MGRECRQTLPGGEAASAGCFPRRTSPLFPPSVVIRKSAVQGLLPVHAKGTERHLHTQVPFIFHVEVQCSRGPRPRESPWGVWREDGRALSPSFPPSRPPFLPAFLQRQRRETEADSIKTPKSLV